MPGSGRATGNGRCNGVSRRRPDLLRITRSPPILRRSGGVAEWLKAHAWKVCIRGTVSRVRIPLPPPMRPGATLSVADRGAEKPAELRRFGAKISGGWRHTTTNARPTVCPPSLLPLPSRSGCKPSRSSNTPCDLRMLRIALRHVSPPGRGPPVSLLKAFGHGQFNRSSRRRQ